jgi:hypothetical protein
MILFHYLAQLTSIKRILWCYLLWYLVILVQYFDADLRMWLTSLGISLIVGTANNLNAFASLNKGKRDPWMIMRFFMAPFCVASFSGMVKGKGFILIFPPSIMETALLLAPCLLFWSVCAGCRSFFNRS